MPRARRLSGAGRLLGGGIALLLGASLAAGGQDPPPLREKVDVVNVEVPVRVFKDGLPVGGLKKSDFRIFEDDAPQAINGFHERRKRMGIQRITLAAEPGEPETPRYFVLCFRISDYNDALRGGVDRFFSAILREQDRLLAFVNERTLLLEPGVGQSRRREILERALREEAARARQGMDAFFQRIRADVDMGRLRTMIEGDMRSFTVPQVIGFLQAYLNAWQEFKAEYLAPDVDTFYNFARHLRRIHGEKWVLSFYQVETFPRIGSAVRQQIAELVGQLTTSGGAALHFARMIGRTLDEIDRDMNAAPGFPAEAIAKMLVGVDTTYHCFISHAPREGVSKDMELRRVASDLEASLRLIAETSGGRAIVSGDIGSALHEIEEQEDVCYVLTYAPGNRERAGKVRVELADPDCVLRYDDRVRSDYIAAYLEEKRAEDPVLRLEKISFSGSRLRLEVSSFRMAPSGGKGAGRLRVTVSVLDDRDRKLYERGRELAAREERVSLSVDFPNLKPGKRFFLVEVQDLLSGRTAVDVLPAEVR